MASPGLRMSSWGFVGAEVKSCSTSGTPTARFVWGFENIRGIPVHFPHRKNTLYKYVLFNTGVWMAFLHAGVIDCTLYTTYLAGLGDWVRSSFVFNHIWDDQRCHRNVPRPKRYLIRLLSTFIFNIKTLRLRMMWWGVCYWSFWSPVEYCNTK